LFRVGILYGEVATPKAMLLAFVDNGLPEVTEPRNPFAASSIPSSQPFKFSTATARFESFVIQKRKDVAHVRV
jgi:hypothetical protein